MADSTTELLPPSLRGTLIGKEKVTGTVVGVGTLAVVGGGVYLALPYIALAMTNMFTILACALGITVIGYAVLNRGMRSAFRLGFAILTRKIHSRIVEQAPYDVVNYVIGCMKNKITDGQQRLGRIRGANQRIKAKIEQNEETIQQKVALARAAEKVGQIARKDAQLRMLGNVQQMNDHLKAQLTMQLKLTDMLQGGLENAQLKVEEQEEAVKLKIEENSLLTDGKEAATDVLTAINGDPDKKALFDEAMSFIAKDSAMKLGQIDQMMIDLGPLMNDIELGKIVDAERGQMVLDSFNTTVAQISAPAPIKNVVAIEAARTAQK
jgi:hypothetical protein